MRLTADPLPAATEHLHDILVPALLKWLMHNGEDTGQHGGQHGQHEQGKVMGGNDVHNDVHNDAYEEKQQADKENTQQENTPPHHTPATPPPLPSPPSSSEAAVVLYGSLLPRLMETLQGVLLRCPYLPGTDNILIQQGEAELRALSDAAAAQVEVLLQVYLQLLPPLRHVARSTMPTWARAAAAGVANGRASPPQTAATDLVGDAHVGDAHVGDAHVGDAHVGDAHVGDAHVGDAHVGDAHVGDAHVGDAHVGDAHVGTQRHQVGHQGVDVQHDGTQPAQPSSTAAPVAAAAHGEDDAAPPATLDTATHESTARPPTVTATGTTTITAPHTNNNNNDDDVDTPGAADGGAAVDGDNDGDTLAAAVDGDGGDDVDTAAVDDNSNELHDDTNDSEVHDNTNDNEVHDNTNDNEVNDEQLHAALACWVNHPQHEEWAVVEAITQVVLPGLLVVTRCIPPLSDMGALRSRMARVLRSTVAMVGQGFSQAVVEPMFFESATVGGWGWGDEEVVVWMCGLVGGGAVCV